MSNIESVMTLITALQSGDIELASNSTTDDFTMSGFMANALDKREFLLLQSRLLVAMPDFSYNMAEPHENVDGSVRALLQIMGTQLNALDLSPLGIQPVEATGLSVTLPQTHVMYRFRGNQVVAMELESLPGGGLAGLLQQVGTELRILPREGNFAD